MREVEEARENFRKEVLVVNQSASRYTMSMGCVHGSKSG